MKLCPINDLTVQSADVRRRCELTPPAGASGSVALPQDEAVDVAERGRLVEARIEASAAAFSRIALWQAALHAREGVDCWRQLMLTQRRCARGCGPVSGSVPLAATTQSPERSPAPEPALPNAPRS